MLQQYESSDHEISQAESKKLKVTNKTAAKVKNRSLFHLQLQKYSPEISSDFMIEATNTSMRRVSRAKPRACRY